MKYRSKKGTVINIPDGLTDRQIAAIKADADAGYGTRAQQTADELGRKLANAQPAAPALNSVAQTALNAASGNDDADASFSTAGKSPAELQAMLARTQAEIEKRGGAAKAPGYASRLQQIQAAITTANQETQNKVQESIAATNAQSTTSEPAPGVVAQPSGYQPGPEPTPAYPSVPFKDPGGSVTSDAVTQKTGINPVVASDNVSKSETNDVNTNFQLEHPQLITDANGNTREITRHADGTVTVKDTKGGTAQTFTDLATAAAQGFNGAADRARAEDATYGTLTKYYDRDMNRELEAQRQDLANRGIPYDPAAANDPNTNNLYGKTIGAIGQKYQGLKDSASQQAVLSGNQAYATTSAARDSFLNAAINGASTFGGNFGQYSNSTTTNQADNDQNILSMTVQDYATRYGLTLAEAQSKRDDATRRAAIAKSGSGGSGKAATTTGGFDV